MYYSRGDIESVCCILDRSTPLREPRGLRAKTDWLDATTIARALRSRDARFGYVPSEEVATYREMVRLHQQLTEEITRDINEIHALVVVLFPEFSQVFADRSRANRFESAQSVSFCPGDERGRSQDTESALA